MGPADPKLKWWKTGLFCDSCHREAAMLTTIKQGDVWDSQEWTRRFVGRRLCHSCISEKIPLILLGYHRTPWTLKRITLLSSMGLALIWVLLVSFLGPTQLTMILFRIGIGVFLSSQTIAPLIDRLRKAVYGNTVRIARKRKPQLVSTEVFFETISSDPERVQEQKDG
ncbi:MAG TPA: hypothetical protein VE955_03200 [Candidatus Dormibacteraeota bacterium]|nr:hypothetical protein [Candidatus Dormibacteraeota bacterium]